MTPTRPSTQEMVSPGSPRTLLIRWVPEVCGEENSTMSPWSIPVSARRAARSGS